MLDGDNSTQSLCDYRTTDRRGHQNPDPKMRAPPFSSCLFPTRLSERPKEVKELEWQVKTCPLHTFIHISVPKKIRELR